MRLLGLFLLGHGSDYASTNSRYSISVPLTKSVPSRKIRPSARSREVAALLIHLGRSDEVEIEELRVPARV